MEHSNGTTLDKYLKGIKPETTKTKNFELLRGRRSKIKLKVLPENIIRRIFKGLTRAILYLHEVANVCHRDIKMSNILIEENEKIKLIDFGFSTSFDYSKEGSLGKPMVSRLCGTPCYMSPELTKIDLGVVNRRSFYNGKAVDVWALGVCLYKMIFGIFPFGGKYIFN